MLNPLWFDANPWIAQLAQFCSKGSNATLAKVARANGLEDLVPVLKELEIAHMLARYIPWPPELYHGPEEAPKQEAVQQPQKGQGIVFLRDAHWTHVGGIDGKDYRPMGIDPNKD